MLSLETCLKLKEAGWEQDGDWLFIKSGLIKIDWQTLPPVLVPRILTEHSNHYRGEHIAACPSLEELLEAVHNLRPLLGIKLDLSLQRGWTSCVYADGMQDGISRQTSPSEAVAALWLKLKEVKQ